MSLLRRIEGQRPAGQPAAPETPGGPPGPPRPPAEGPLSQTAAPSRDATRDARVRLQTRIINNLDPRLDLSDAKAVRSNIEEMFNRFLDEEGIVVTRVERQRMLEQILDEILGFGPIQPLLNDDSITEVMVNGPYRVYVERKGKLSLADVTFVSDEHVMRVIERIIAPIGRRVDESKPYEDARLPDGSRVNIIIPPLALNGPTVTIRKFPKYRITVDDYVKFGTATPEMMEFMRACVEARLNMFISGGTGSGKTTTLNVLGSQDDAAQHPLGLHPGGRADHHDRGRGRAPARAGPRRAPRVARREHRGQGPGHDHGPGEERPPYAPGAHRRG